MTMGTGLVLVAIGAILRYAVKDEWDVVDLTTRGADPDDRRSRRLHRRRDLRLQQPDARRAVGSALPARSALLRRGGAYAAARGRLARSSTAAILAASSPDVVLGGGVARGRVRRRQRGRPLERRGQGADVAGVDEHPGLRRDELGRPADRRSRRRSAPSPSPSRVAWPKGSISEGWQRTSQAATQCGTSACGIRPATVTSGRGPRARSRSGPSPTKARRPRPRRAKASARRDHVLALDQRADAEERRARRRPSRARARAAAGVGGAEGVEVDAAVGDLDLRPGRRDPLGEALGEPARVRDHGRRAPATPAASPASTPADLGRGWRRPGRGP